MIQSVFLLKSVLKQLLWESLTQIQISVVVLLLEGFAQGAVRKELIIVPFIMEL